MVLTALDDYLVDKRWEWSTTIPAIRLRQRLLNISGLVPEVWPFIHCLDSGTEPEKYGLSWEKLSAQLEGLARKALRPEHGRIPDSLPYYGIEEEPARKKPRDGTRVFTAFRDAAQFKTRTEGQSRKFSAFRDLANERNRDIGREPR